MTSDWTIGPGSNHSLNYHIHGHFYVQNQWIDSPPISSGDPELCPVMTESGAQDDSFREKKGFFSTQHQSFVIRNDFLPFGEGRGHCCWQGSNDRNGGSCKRTEYSVAR
ncbi:hypothetical protein CEXT_109791 [Caerostris extrusa]|uniref:Uncharacterized protein n=1 Tax=Caerostris extrusa TaxID=172846 RepID=A0AAV4QTE0_CAEEX|nr:hypothetical protein CEXT_109791 [Caerostris extrusa]